MLELTNVTAGYGSITALHGVTLRVEKGSIVTLVGANGAGKSTTLRAISGLVKVREGSKVKKIFENLAERLKDYNGPAWVSFDVGKMEGQMLSKPKNTETFLDINAVLEFYSR